MNHIIITLVYKKNPSPDTISAESQIEWPPESTGVTLLLFSAITHPIFRTPSPHIYFFSIILSPWIWFGTKRIFLYLNSTKKCDIYIIIPYSYPPLSFHTKILKTPLFLSNALPLYTLLLWFHKIFCKVIFPKNSFNSLYGFSYNI